MAQRIKTTLYNGSVISSLNLHSFTALQNGDPACVKVSPFSLWDSNASREAGKCFQHIKATIGYIFMYPESPFLLSATSIILFYKEI